MATKQSKRKQASKPAAQAPVAPVEPDTFDELVVGESKIAASEVKAMTNVVTAAAHGNANELIALPSSCTVRDSAALKAELMLLYDRPSVTINLHAVERVDTAVLQLLLAFVRDRIDAGRSTQWTGMPECINEAVGILGLSERLQLPLYDAVA